MATSTDTVQDVETAQVAFPSGVTATLTQSALSIKGPLGENTKDFSRVPVTLSLQGSVLRIQAPGRRRRDHAMVNTARSIIKKMVDGVTKGFVYRLKIVFAHFPVSVKIKGDEVHIENFYGERAPRIAKIVGDCKVSVEGDDVVVKGVSLEDVGQTAANIEQATTVKRKDQRVFLDGIYVYEKTRGK